MNWVLKEHSFCFIHFLLTISRKAFLVPAFRCDVFPFVPLFPALSLVFLQLPGFPATSRCVIDKFCVPVHQIVPPIFDLFISKIEAHLFQLIGNIQPYFVSFLLLLPTNRSLFASYRLIRALVEMRLQSIAVLSSKDGSTSDGCGTWSWLISLIT